MLKVFEHSTLQSRFTLSLVVDQACLSMVECIHIFGGHWCSCSWFFYPKTSINDQKQISNEKAPLSIILSNNIPFQVNPIAHDIMSFFVITKLQMSDSTISKPVIYCVSVDNEYNKLKALLLHNTIIILKRALISWV